MMIADNDRLMQIFYKHVNIIWWGLLFHTICISKCV